MIMKVNPFSAKDFQVDEKALKSILTRGGRKISQPALEALELAMDISTPIEVRTSMIAALTYLLIPMDLIPDLIPSAGLSDDFLAIATILGIWKKYITPEIRTKAAQKLDKWLPL